MRDGKSRVLPPRGPYVEFAHGSPGTHPGDERSCTRRCPRIDDLPLPRRTAAVRVRAPKLRQRHLHQSRPLGGLSDNIGFGYGLNAAYCAAADHAGYLSLRTDAGFVDYGSEVVPRAAQHHGRRPHSGQGFDEQLHRSAEHRTTAGDANGTDSPYVNGGIAAQIFFTESGVEGSDDSYDFANTTNQHDWTSTGRGGGVYVPIYRQENVGADRCGHPVFWRRTREISASGQHPGSAERADSITPLESETRLRWSTSGEAGAVISIVDASDLQYVLRPTVYRPVAEAGVILMNAASGGYYAPDRHPDASVAREGKGFAPTEPEASRR